MSPFVYHRTLRLHETDATGVLYFAEQFKIALEAFEEFLVYRGFSLRELTRSPYLMPVVRAEADYFLPLQVGDCLDVEVRVEEVGTTSLTMGYVLKQVASGEVVGKVRIVHVLVDQVSRQAIQIPEELKNYFNFSSAGGQGRISTGCLKEGSLN